MQNPYRKRYNGINTNAFRYCGEYYDKETGTIYLRARYYNPSNGRFTQRDSFAGKQGDPLSLNLYTYCGNNPIIYIDFSGNDYYYYYGDDQEKAYKINKKLLEKSGEAVYGYYIDSQETFTDYWNDMNTTDDDSIIINLHGNDLGVQYMDVNQLNNKTLDTLYLLSCNGGRQDTTGNIASQVYNLFNINKLVAADGLHTRKPSLFNRRIIHSIGLDEEQKKLKSTKKSSKEPQRVSQGFVLYNRDDENNINVVSIGKRFESIIELTEKTKYLHISKNGNIHGGAGRKH